MENKSNAVDRKISTLSYIVGRILKYLRILLIVIAVSFFMAFAVMAYQFKHNGVTAVCCLVTESNGLLMIADEIYGLDGDEILDYERNIPVDDRRKMNDIIAKAINDITYSDIQNRDSLKTKLKGILTDEEYKFLYEQYQIMQH